jgi:biotin-(acetyl-CoA carboxylase) ligase
LTRALGIGQKITVNFADGTQKHGIFVNLSPDGGLSLDINGVTETIHSGDIFLV